jgi:hypothetical protein
MRTRKKKQTIKARFKLLLFEAAEVPLMNLDQITPPEFMEYIDQLRHFATKKRLSKSAYGNKRSALNDLFRWHQTDNRSFSPAFASELKDLYKGFFRIITQQGREDIEIGGEHGRNVKEGKDAMNVELYQALCVWFLELGTDEGIFAHCFLVLTWNLMCRANSTSQVCFNHIFWTTSDSLEIHFAHHKGDQMGTQAAYPRHLYSNPLHPCVCPIFALALYLMTFNTIPFLTGRLFPGKNQFKRFSDIMQAVLKAHEAEVRRYGHEVKDLGTHSIRKGAATYASNCPGGPPAASIFIRAGWSMGRVRDIYLKWERGGDQFVGRCLSLLPLLKAEFGASPPHFSRALPGMDPRNNQQCLCYGEQPAIFYSRARDVPGSDHLPSSNNPNVGFKSRRTVCMSPT